MLPLDWLIVKEAASFSHLDHLLYSHVLMRNLKNTLDFIHHHFPLFKLQICVLSGKRDSNADQILVTSASCGPFMDTILSIKDDSFWRCFKKYFINKNFWALCAPRPSASAPNVSHNHKCQSQPLMLVTSPDVSPIPIILLVPFP